MANLNDLLTKEGNPFRLADGSPIPPEGQTQTPPQEPAAFTTQQVEYQAASFYVSGIVLKELRNLLVHLLPPKATVEEVDFYVNHFKDDIVSAWGRHYPREVK